MRLSTVFELLLIFVLIAFAASASVKGSWQGAMSRKRNNGVNKRKNERQDNAINKYCTCTDITCKCCRNFQLPLVNVDGPGCASLMYLLGDRMAVSLSFGNRVITNRTLSGRKPKPVCMPLPGGVSKFCGRVYNIAREGEDFRACLGLELQSKSDVEAAIRVSCFKFGPKGVNSEPGDPLPLVPKDEADDDDDDDDDDEDDDDFGLGVDDDDDEEDDDADNDVDTADYTGFSILGDDLLGGIFGSTGNKNKKPNKKKTVPVTTAATVSSTTKRPRPTRRTTTRRPTTARPVRTTTVRLSTTRGTRRPARRPTSPRTRPPKPTRRTTPSPISTTLAVSDPINNEITTLEQTKPSTVAGTLQTPAPVAPPKASEQIEDEHLEQVVIVTQTPKKPVSTTIRSPQVTNIEDPGIQLSLAALTGQLQELPVTTIISTKAGKNQASLPDDMQYEKIETVTQKYTPNQEFTASSEKTIESSESFIEIVSDPTELESSRSQGDIDQDHGSESGEVYFEEIRSNKNNVKKDKKNKNKNNDNDDDPLGISMISESLGFSSGKGKRNKKPKDSQVNGNIENDYHDFLGLESLTDSIMETKPSKKKNRGRNRQNKMMRGEWSLA